MCAEADVEPLPERDIMRQAVGGVSGLTLDAAQDPSGERRAGAILAAPRVRGRIEEDRACSGQESHAYGPSAQRRNPDCDGEPCRCTGAQIWSGECEA